MKTGIVILAAGSSSRLGQSKQLLQYQGCTLLKRTVNVCIESEAHPVVVVLGADYDECVLELQNLKLHLRYNPRYPEGISTSIHAGLDALLSLDPDIDAALFCLCDQPYLTEDFLNQMIAKFESGDAEIIASAYANTIGAPALFAKKYFPELYQLRGDQGARKLLLREEMNRVEIPFPKGEEDIDTVEDYARLIAG